MADDGLKQPVIVRIKKVGGAAHGGAWKVAYADFVTAMMAFFLLLWLLNAVEHPKIEGVADYFAPVSATRSTSGSAGIFGGDALTKGGVNAPAPSIIATPLPVEVNPPGDDEFGGEDEGLIQTKKPIEGDTMATSPDDVAGNAPTGATVKPPKIADPRVENKDGTTDPNAPEVDKLSPEDMRKELAKREEQRFETAERRLNAAIQQNPLLNALKDSLKIDRTPEGLRIQLLDQDRFSMFPTGSNALYDQTRAILQAVAKVISVLPNRIKIEGHTDSVPFNGANGYSNWDLSVDRANAARQVLMQSGIPESRIAQVVGLASTDPALPDDPTNPRNRRITMVLLTDLPSTSGYDPNAAPELLK